MFLRISTQWRPTYGALVGLDYNVLFSMMELYQVADRKAVLEDIQTMECAALNIINNPDK